MPADLTPYQIRVSRGSAVSTEPRISIIILVTDDTGMLERCLQSLTDTHSLDDRSEVIVLGNGTPDQALASVGARHDITLLRSAINHGFGGGCNLAVRCARGQRLVFLNDDVVVGDGWLNALDRALDDDDDIAVAGSKVLLSADRLQEAGSILWRDGSTSGRGRDRRPDLPEYSVSRRVDYVSFCSAIVRRAAWDVAGGFDERYFPAYYEDADLCLTLQRLGWRVMFEAASIVTHAEGGSGRRDYRDFLSRRNQAHFVAKWAPVLQEYDDPPSTERDRLTSEEHAVRRTEHRRAPAKPTGSATSHVAQPATATAFDDLDILVVDVRHLSAALSVAAAYIDRLREEATSIDVATHLKRRLLTARTNAARRLRRHRSHGWNRRRPL